MNKNTIKYEDWEEHPTLKGCFQLVKDCFMFRINDTGWVIFRLPNLAIVATQEIKGIEQAHTALMKYLRN